MKKKRFSVEQMIGVLKQAEVGVPVAEVIRKAGISEQTFYRWKAKYTFNWEIVQRSSRSWGTNGRRNSAMRPLPSTKGI
jgi:DNA invertase Pin-like site-specific DNA recombinase